MGLRLSPAARNAAGDAITALLNAGGAGTIDIRTGAQPTDPATAATGTVLATFTLPATAFAAFTSGTGNLNTVAAVTASATGTAGWFRMKNNAGTGVIDGTVGTSGAELNLTTTSIQSGGNVSITGGSLSMPVGT
jgi:hypothetical protein